MKPKGKLITMAIPEEEIQELEQFAAIEKRNRTSAIRKGMQLYIDSIKNGGKENE